MSNAEATNVDDSAATIISPPFAIGEIVVAKRDYTGSIHNCILKGGHYKVVDCVWSERHQRWTIELDEKYDTCWPEDFDHVGG